MKRSHLKCTDIINRRCDFSLLFHFGYFVSLKEETSLCRNQAYKRLTEVTSQNTLHSSSSDAEIPHDFFQRFNSDSSTHHLKKGLQHSRFCSEISLNHGEFTMSFVLHYLEKFPLLIKVKKSISTIKNLSNK